MPSMADITVKKADTTTNIVWTALNPSSGDTVPAYWRSETMSAQASARASMSSKSSWNGPKDARRIETSITYPHTSTDSTTGITSVIARVPISIVATVPVSVPDTVVAEAIAQAFNLQVSTLMLSVYKTGFAPT